MKMQDDNSNLIENREHEDKSYTLYALGFDALKSGNLSLAKKLLQDSNQLRAHPHTLFRLAEVCEVEEDWKLAHSFLLAAYKLKPNIDVIGVRLAQSFFRKGELEKAHCGALEILARNGSYGPAKELVRKLDQVGFRPDKINRASPSEL